MNDNELVSAMKEKSVVMAEIPITKGQLHQIATGKCCTMSLPGELFAVRFLVKGSYKVAGSNYINHMFNMQVIALGKDNAMRKEDIGTVVKYAKKEEKKVEEPKFEIKNTKEELF